jgi:hypothetical protein
MSNLAETLYYQIYNFVLLGDSDNAKTYLGFLREEYDKDESQFNALKEDERWKHLIELGDVIDKNLIVKNFQEVERPVEKIIKEEDEAQFSKQRELVKAICLAKDELRMCLKAESDFCCTSIEYETKFGRVDLVAQDKETIYPIEVKKSGADHSVIGQIDKYIIHFKLGLINRMYRYVVGVVIANGFDEYSLQELHRFGAIAIKYKFKGDNRIELSRA